MSTLNDGKVIEYNITDASQLTFLRLLTTNVSQTITYNCRNSIALGDAKRSLKLLTSIDVELTNEEGKNQYDVISDECTVRDGQWHQTRVGYESTTRSSRLPIIDVAAGDIGGVDQEFSWEVEPVCFV